MQVGRSPADITLELTFPNTRGTSCEVALKYSLQEPASSLSPPQPSIKYEYCFNSGLFRDCPRKYTCHLSTQGSTFERVSYEASWTGVFTLVLAVLVLQYIPPLSVVLPVIRLS